MSCVLSSCTKPDCTPRQISSNARESIVLLHGSASSAEMWDFTCDALDPLFRCITPDLIGYGGAEAWSFNKPFELDSELEAIKSLLPCCGEKMHIVGYSYGGVLGLHLALSNPVLVQTLTLVEPVFFAALRYTGSWQAYKQFCNIRDIFKSQLGNGDTEAAMSEFTDFWAGEGTWRSSSQATRDYMQKMANKISLDWQASFDADPGQDSLASLGSRTMLIRGGKSPAPMCKLVDSLHELMPGSTRIVIQGSNHMLPFTHKFELRQALISQLHVDAERRLR